MATRARLLLLFPALAVLCVAAELIHLGLPYLTDPQSSRADLVEQALASLGALAWNAMVPGALVVLVLVTVRAWPRGLPLAAGTCVVFSGAVIAAMIVLALDDSSTGVLLLLFLPVQLGLALIPFVGLTFLVHWVRGRRAAGTRQDRRSSAGGAAAATTGVVDRADDDQDPAADEGDGPAR